MDRITALKHILAPQIGEEAVVKIVLAVLEQEGV